MAKGKAVVVGGLGMIGRNIIQALEAEGGWDIVGLSRRPANFETEATFISVDLLNNAGAKETLAGLTDVTHIFYAGLSGGLAAENVEANLALVRNSVGVIEPISSGLQRVVLFQGGKYYGVHLGPHKSPSKESDPRILPPNFYYNQQDFIADLQAGKSWHCTMPAGPKRWSALPRGFHSTPPRWSRSMRAVCKALDVPLNYPGPEAGLHRLQQVRGRPAARPLRRLGRPEPRLRRRGLQRDQRLGHALVQPVADLHRVFRLPAGHPACR